MISLVQVAKREDVGEIGQMTTAHYALHILRPCGVHLNDILMAVG